jgi:hypothetical protein
MARADNVAEVPEYRVRTTLQRGVPVLKWYCAIRFATDPNNRPPSILITALAAWAYDGESDLFSTTLHAVRRMREWLLHYELWLTTGKWLGGGHEVATP